MQLDDDPPGATKSLRAWLKVMFGRTLASEDLSEGDNIEFDRGDNGEIVIHSRPGGGSGGEGGTGTETYYVVINGALYTQDFVVDGDPVAV